MPVTYDSIATTTLGSAASEINFTSIPSSFTDLRLVVVATSATSNFLYMRLNGDTGTNYSRTTLQANGSTASSNRGTGESTLVLANIFGGLSSTAPDFLAVDLFSYSGSTNKTLLAENNFDQNGSGEITRTVCLWRNTAAVNAIRLYVSSGNFAAGTTATLYGILRA